MSEKGNLPQGGTEVVSVDVKAIAAAEKALLASGIKKAAALRSPEEAAAVKKYQKLEQKKSRARQAVRKDAVNGLAQSREEVSKKEARHILVEERLIRNPR